MTRTSWPDSVNRRSNSHALYAAIPPQTPSTTRGRDPRSAVIGDSESDLDVLERQQVLVGLAQRHRQRLFLHVRRHQWTDVLEQPFAQLGVVGVDLARALRGIDHQRVLALDL